MADPLDKATSKAPPTVGEGCQSRYDVDELSPEDGAEFEGAAELWQQLQLSTENPSDPAPNSGDE